MDRPPFEVARALRVSLHSDALTMGLDGPEIKFREVKGILIPIEDELKTGILTFHNPLLTPSLRVEYVSHGVISTTVAQIALTATGDFNDVSQS